MSVQHRDKLHDLIESAVGKGAVSHDGFAALDDGRITTFCQQQLESQAIQIEMKPSVRSVTAVRRFLLRNAGAFSASPNNVVKMLGALEAFIEYLNKL